MRCSNFVLALTAVLGGILGLAVQEVSAQTIGSKMASFLEGKRGVRLGAGECADLATEALRNAGGEFIRTDLGADKPNSGDYVWGTLVKTISYNSSTGKVVDSNPSSKVLPGDIVQYRNVKLVYDTYTATASHHTSVVAKTTSPSGQRPAEVYEQNIGKFGKTGDVARTVNRRSIGLLSMRAGWVKIYRPKARKNTTNSFKFTLRNYTSSSKSYKLRFGTGSSYSDSYSLTSNNTLGSFRTWKASSSTGKVYIYLNSSNLVQVSNGAAYEFYTSGSTTKIRKLSY